MKMKSFLKVITLTLVCALTMGIIPTPNEIFPDLSTKVSAETYYVTYPEENTDFYIAAEADTNYVIDLCGGGTETYTGFQLYEKNGTDAQIYTLKRVDGDWYVIYHKKSGQCLNVVYGESYDDARFWLYPYNEGDYASQFRFAAAGDSYIIQNRLDTQRIIDLHDNIVYSGAKVHLWSLHDGQSGRWKLIPVNSYTYSYKTVTLGSFSTINEWKEQLTYAQMKAAGFAKYGTLPNGEMVNYGNMIVGAEVLERKTITYTIDRFGKLETHTAELPSKIRFKLHKHDIKKRVWFDFTNLTLTQYCEECGEWKQLQWEVPYPD